MSANAHQNDTSEGSHRAALAEREAALLRVTLRSCGSTVTLVASMRSGLTRPHERSPSSPAARAVILQHRLQRRARLLLSALTACLYVVTLAACAPAPTGHDLTFSEAAAPGSVQQPTVPETNISKPVKPQKMAKRDVQVTGSAKQHAKGEDWSLQSKTGIPLPDPKLLQPPIESKCELEDDPEFKTDDPRRLDLEKQCYRESAVITRNRLLLLQTSVDKMIKAVIGAKTNQP